MWKEFKEFALRGSALELAIGVVIGAAFGQITNSLVNDVIMPPLSFITGRVDFSSLFIPLSARHFASIAAARAAGVPTINYGYFLNALINFVIVALAVFFMIRQVNRFFRLELAKKSADKICPYCASKIPLAAVKCPNCTSNLT